jgi:hypothetical protein
MSRGLRTAYADLLILGDRAHMEHGRDGMMRRGFNVLKQPLLVEFPP